MIGCGYLTVRCSLKTATCIDTSLETCASQVAATCLLALTRSFTFTLPLKLAPSLSLSGALLKYYTTISSLATYQYSS